MAKKKEMDNLAKDMIQCKKDGYGCHYGAWKAAQTPVKIKPKKLPIGIETIKCAYCGAEFMSDDNRTRICCGDRCRMLNRSERNRKQYMKRVEREIQNEIESGTR